MICEKNERKNAKDFLCKTFIALENENGKGFSQKKGNIFRNEI